MGHSEKVHKDFYGQQESSIEKTHILKKYKGKTLKEVLIEDIITAATISSQKV